MSFYTRGINCQHIKIGTLIEITAGTQLVTLFLLRGQPPQFGGWPSYLPDLSHIQRLEKGPCEVIWQELRQKSLAREETFVLSI